MEPEKPRHHGLKCLSILMSGIPFKSCDIVLHTFDLRFVLHTSAIVVAPDVPSQLRLQLGITTEAVGATPDLPTTAFLVQKWPLLGIRHGKIPCRNLKDWGRSFHVKDWPSGHLRVFHGSIYISVVLSVCLSLPIYLCLKNLAAKPEEIFTSRQLHHRPLSRWRDEAPPLRKYPTKTTIYKKRKVVLNWLVVFLKNIILLNCYQNN